MMEVQEPRPLAQSSIPDYLGKSVEELAQLIHTPLQTAKMRTDELEIRMLL